MTTSLGDWDYPVAPGVDVLLGDIEITRCSNQGCAEEIAALPNIEQLHRVIAHDVASSQQRLTAAELKFLGKFLVHRGVRSASLFLRIGGGRGSARRRFADVVLRAAVMATITGNIEPLADIRLRFVTPQKVKVARGSSQRWQSSRHERVSAPPAM